METLYQTGTVCDFSVSDFLINKLNFLSLDGSFLGCWSLYLLNCQTIVFFWIWLTEVTYCGKFKFFSSLNIADFVVWLYCHDLWILKLKSLASRGDSVFAKSKTIIAILSSVTVLFLLYFFVVCWSWLQNYIASYSLHSGPFSEY